MRSFRSSMSRCGLSLAIQGFEEAVKLSASVVFDETSIAAHLPFRRSEAAVQLDASLLASKSSLWKIILLLSELLKLAGFPCSNECFRVC